MLPGTAFCRICLAAQRDGSQAEPFIDLTLDCKREKEIGRTGDLGGCIVKKEKTKTGLKRTPPKG